MTYHMIIISVIITISISERFSEVNNKEKKSKGFIESGRTYIHEGENQTFEEGCKKSPCTINVKGVMSYFLHTI